MHLRDYCRCCGEAVGGTGGGLPSVGSCSSHPDIKKADLKKETTARGLTTEGSGFLGFLFGKTHVSGRFLKSLRLQYRHSLFGAPLGMLKTYNKTKYS